MADNANSSSIATPRIKSTWSAPEVANYLESRMAPLRAFAKYKERSFTTSKTVHIPLLEAATKDAPDQGPTVVLLGDSMLERMTTTGQSPNFTAPWPSPAMLPDGDLEALRATREEEVLDIAKKARRPARDLIRRVDRVFNAGVGGDKIQNLAYRLVGDPYRGLPGLLPMLARCGTVRLWVLHIGTNHLSPKRGLSGADIEALEVLIDTLLRLPATKGVHGKVLLTGILLRREVPLRLRLKANTMIEALEVKMKIRWGEERVERYEPRDQLKPDEHLDDHVHLNLKGYQWWIRLFLVHVVTMLDVSEVEAERWKLMGGFEHDRLIPWFANDNDNDIADAENDSAQAGQN
ncbi:uncharacterized protein B0T15DRAFT_516544 [Chaetomium strumarium]|uniref:SGNH hydrolase-type esterase domain-containing protein n=1 Tax=Chaetomium strumarium TaxID=1170767 RepID=A0AAJ0M5M6_9PEZI|nr:hypothetical protein B0T15DRAFT_516544 [Chaetomium strumarium]